MKFGDKLRQARARAGMTQEDVIKKIGVTRQSLSNWENDRTYPDLASVVKLSDLYQVPLDDLLREDMELRRQMEKQQEKMKKICTLILSLACLLFGSFPLLRWFEHAGLALTLGSIGLLLVIVVHYLLVRFLGATRKLILLRCFTLIFVSVQCYFFYGSDGIYGSGDIRAFQVVLMLLSTILIGYTSYRMQDEPVHLRMNAITGFVLAIALVFSFFPHVGNFVEQGDHVEVNPFHGPNRYRVQEVLQGPDEKIPIVYLVTNEHVSLEFPCGEEFQLEGKFTYINQPEGATTKGVWEMLDSGFLYRITVEADDSVTLGCQQDGQVQWQYRLELAPSMGVMIKDVLSTGFGSANWYYADTFDSSGELKGWGLDGKGTIRLAVPGSESTVTIYEEYRDGDTVEYNTMVLTRDKNGNVEFKRETRQDGGEQTGIYRIPYENGEFVLVITFNK